MARKIVGIVGSYRKGRIIDSAVSAVLKGAEEKGAQTQKIYLVDKHIEFCTNCRTCAQQDTQGVRAPCIHDDDMEEILRQIDEADGIVLASPVNLGTVTAITKRFLERLIVYSYWPWGSPFPRPRIKKSNKKAIIITSSACSTFLGRIFFRNALVSLKWATKWMGANVVRSLYFGTVCLNEDSGLNDKALLRAKKAGAKLVS
jgi:multimeric flavodoxin WrbA